MSDRAAQSRSRRTAAALVAAVVPILALGCTASSSEEEESAEAPPAPPPGRRAARVARVIDGDTLELATGERIRLVQIDAPEATGECYGRKAGDVLRRLLPAGSKVRLARDPGLDDVDRYGRLLRYVFRGGRNVNLLLVKRGAASVWFYGGDRGRYANALQRAAEAARADGRGAWRACEASLDPSGAFQTRPGTATAAPAPVAASRAASARVPPLLRRRLPRPRRLRLRLRGRKRQRPGVRPGPGQSRGARRLRARRRRGRRRLRGLTGCEPESVLDRIALPVVVEVAHL
jgi:endonuclease YncB( thermonuclease family)